MKIGNREIGDKTFIIAEAGICHADSSPAYRRTNAEKLCHILGGGPGFSERPKPDAIKFQMFVPDEDLFCPLPGDEARWVRWNQSLMSLDDWRSVKDCAEGLGMVFLASAFQPTAVEWLKELKVDAYKVGSRAEQTYPYDSVPGPFIVSMGANNDSILPGRVFLSGLLNYIHLQCDMEYPGPARQWTEWDGLSDHSGTVWPGMDAIASGALILEVHIDFHLRPNVDKAASISTADLQLLCRARDGIASLL